MTTNRREKCTTHEYSHEHCADHGAKLSVSWSSMDLHSSGNSSPHLINDHTAASKCVDPLLRVSLQQVPALKCAHKPHGVQQVVSEHMCGEAPGCSCGALQKPNIRPMEESAVIAMTYLVEHRSNKLLDAKHSIFYRQFTVENLPSVRQHSTPTEPVH